jgi:HAD superfamily hydrolase (TIGR01509 family)
MDLSAKLAWIFDLDGTLTESVHDFDAIRAELGLPAKRSILESIEKLEPSEAEAARAQLIQIEQRYATLASPRRSATRLLGMLRQRGAQLGILTRNAADVAHATLAHVGLSSFFDPAHVLGRESAAAKPSPAGVELLLARWTCAPQDAVMVGDYLFDIEAGVAAGVTTVCLDPADGAEWVSRADLRVADLSELYDHAAGVA